MGIPRGRLFTPVAPNPSGVMRTMQVDDDDALLVASNAPSSFPVGLYSYYNSAWVHQSPILGYNGVVSDVVLDTNASAGTNTLSGNAVPSDTIWQIEAINLFDANHAITGSRIVLAGSGGVNIILGEYGALAAASSEIWLGRITMSPGEYIFVYFYGCTSGDDLYLRYHGFYQDLV